MTSFYQLRDILSISFMMMLHGAGMLVVGLRHIAQGLAYGEWPMCTYVRALTCLWSG
jgi:hypothetical protein